MPRRLISVSTIALALGAALSGGGGAAASGDSAPPSARPGSAPLLAPIHGTYTPKIEPANFVATIDNRYLPFKPGTAFHYLGVRGTTPQTDDEVVTHQTKTILGVRSTV